MQKFLEFFIERENFSYLLIGALVFVGLFSVIQIPKESSPEVRIPIAVVTTALPGASAVDVEQLVTVPIEDQLTAGLSDVKTITSTSREGVSVVVAEFNANADIDASIQEAKDEVDKVTGLPEDATDPTVAEVNFVDQPIFQFSLASDLPPSEFIVLAEQLEDEISKISGVSKVTKSGLPQKEVQVVVNQESLDRYGLDLGTIVGALARSNLSLPVGSIRLDGIRYAINLEGDIQSPQDVRDIPLVNRGGVTVYVRDVAFVSDGVGESTTIGRLSLDGNPARQAISFGVFKKSGGDVTKVTKSVNEKISELQQTILADTDVLVTFNTGDDVRKDLVQLSLSGLQTVILVLIVLVLAIGWREAIIAALAIPLSFLIAFIGLNASGNTINFVSLFSLILAVGILVDSAIVVTEGIYTKISEGFSKKQAAKEALRELAWPVIAGTMTTIAVFFPLFFLSGVTGKFIASIPFTIIFVLLAALFVALAIVPLLAVAFLQPKNHVVSKLEEKQENLTHRLQTWYRSVLDNLVGNRKKENRFRQTIIILLIISLIMPFVGFVKTIFFPGEDAEFLFVDIEMRQGTSLLETDLAVREAEGVLQANKNIESFVTSVGSLSAFTTGDSGSEKANITVLLQDKRKLTSGEIVTMLRSDLSAALPSSTVRIAELSSGPPVGAPVSVTFEGEEMGDLYQAVAMSQEILNDIEGTRDIDSSLADDGIDFTLSLDREKVTQAGLDVATISQLLRTAVYGTKATTIRSGGDDIDVIVRLGLNPDFVDISSTVQTDLDAIRYIPIPTQSGRATLGEFVSINLQQANGIIRREDGKRIATVTSEILDGYNAREITADFIKRLEGTELPEGINFSSGGESEETNQSFAEMGMSLIYGVILIMAILVLQFNSFRQAFIIISILPFILIGIFWGLALTGQAISFPSIMGFIAVAGIAVNNSIILIDVMNSLRKDNPSWSSKQIVIEGSVTRLRPIILTTLTTVIGIAPLTYATAIWAPLAWSVIFGLTFTVVLTLILIPILYARRLDKNTQAASN
jgi:multidrug efflux pump